MTTSEGSLLVFTNILTRHTFVLKNITVCTGQDNSAGDEDSAGIAIIDITSIITMVVIVAVRQRQQMSNQLFLMIG
jgi:hypothetical protein